MSSGISATAIPLLPLYWNKEATFGELSLAVDVVESRNCGFETKMNLIQLDEILSNILRESVRIRVPKIYTQLF